MKLIIDSQEDKKIVNIAKRLDIDFEVKKLPVGDFLFEDGNKQIIFERKTAGDFANSIRSGHLQKQLLQQNNYEHSYLLISGHFKDLFFNKAIKHFTIEHWLGSLASCAVRYNTKILQVDNDVQLMKLIVKICDKTNDGKIVGIRDTELLKNSFSGDDMMLRLLICFEGVGVKKGGKLLEDIEINSKLSDFLRFFKDKGIYKGILPL